MQSIRKIEGTGTIQRPQDNQYINTTYLPYQKTVKSVNYYARRKKQLKRNPSNEVIINLTNRNAQRSDLKSHIQTLFKSNKNIDPFISNYIKQIRVDPVINDNKFTNFNEQLYSLNEDEKVKVLEERYFPLQNYYNYIYDLELKKEISRFVVQNDSNIQEANENKSSTKSIQVGPLEIGKQIGFPFTQKATELRNSIEDKKIKGFYESRFQPKRNQDKIESQATILNDKNMIGDQTKFRFSVNQNKRMELSIKK